MDDENEVEQIFAQVPNFDLDPGQVNLLLSSLKPVPISNNGGDKMGAMDFSSDMVDCSVEGFAGSPGSNMGYKVDESATYNTEVCRNTSPHFYSTPPPPISNFNVHQCRLCDFFSLSSDTCGKHERGEHPPPRPTIQCISCSNIFLSIQALKVHLLLDHEVLKSELQSILLLTLKKSEEFLSSSNPPSNAVHSMDTNKEWSSGRRKKNYDSDAQASTSFADVEQTKSSNTFSSDNTGFNLPQSSIETSNDGLSRLYQRLEVNKEILDMDRPPSSGGINSLPANSDRNENFVANSPKHVSIASSQDSKSENSSDEDDYEDEDAFSDDSDDVVCASTLEDATETINKHLHLMDQMKKEKSKANRCLVSVKCHLRFKSLNTLNYHKKCHDLEKGWKCPECSSSFSAWNSLSLHLWNQHSIDMELYYCNFCSFRTPNLSHLRTTHIWIHGKAKMFSCPICQKAVKTKKQLRNHQAIHKKVGMRYECKECKALFSRKHLLRQHSDTVHRRTKRFKCSTCGRTSASRSSHHLHLRKHTNEKKYACGECCYWTGDHNALRRHLATHSGVRPYSCPHCVYTSISSTSLKAHVNSKHPGMLGDVLFSCPLCPFKTLRKDLFVAHTTKHNFTSESQPCINSRQVDTNISNPSLS